MKIYNTKVYVSYNYGAWSLIFKRHIMLSFPPFHGLGLIFDNDIEFKIDNDGYTRSTISYDVEKDQFIVDIKNKWSNNLTKGQLDCTLDTHKNWEMIKTGALSLFSEMVEENNRK